MIVIGGAALLFFGPDQLPKVARKVGTVVRDVQSTSQSFIREMERAADEQEAAETVRYTPPPPAPPPAEAERQAGPFDTAPHEATTNEAATHEAGPHDAAPHETTPHEPATEQHAPP
jgi:Sec-independent protein translocase protein TatA